MSICFSLSTETMKKVMVGCFCSFLKEFELLCGYNTDFEWDSKSGCNSTVVNSCDTRFDEKVKDKEEKKNESLFANMPSGHVPAKIYLQTLVTQDSRTCTLLSLITILMG